MGHLTKLLCVCVLAPLVGGCASEEIATGTDRSDDGSSHVPVGSADHNLEQVDLLDELLQLVNGSREQAAVPPLEWSEPCALAARDHAAYLAHTETLSHVGEGGSRLGARVRGAGVSGATLAAEALASGQRTAREVFNSWRDSEEHWTNLMDPEMTHVGVSFRRAQDGAGIHYWVLVLVRIPE
jgi:uncharacterized protein YkwD